MKIALQGKSFMVHLAVWLSYLFLLVLFFSESRDIDSSLYRSIIIVIVQAIVFYINLFYLLPFLLEKKKYLFYIVSLIVLIILFVLLFDRVLNYFMLDDGRPFSGGGSRSGISDEFRDRPFRGGKRSFKGMGGPFMIYARFIMNAFFIFIALFSST
ncbi:MAG: hypothetical protein K8R74_05130, partial [Bacteroidales bacterium]|nr:hypothetical protein [Bacteroidales bacterium]